MSNQNILSIVSLIKSGNIIYERAISNIKSDKMKNNLFDIYTVKKCAELKLRSLTYYAKNQQDEIPASYTINARERCIEAEEKNGTSNEDLYLMHLEGVEKKIISDIESLLTTTPNLEGKNKLQKVKNEMENCRDQIHRMREH
ncbi:DUF2383 domain-containing protein [Vibrio toranzoniae]|jgi:hypothetical protein|uniref:DUF2383 domain-containing protein n=1 Tax=Vibrio toranzoniae TaxID=1194427 RepID=UPI001378084F|nr:DUF2383 domain-containing protein [Vibrio toranzoniae]NAZ45561.1 DUF2383 domain-containing protein [Vibrio toranzoniae]NAZ91072.1 DUF2383 domain-containing protein [Vibrio toranzoniae]NAZ95005.1 DUF2383 domain-containing protein [Vibrio toranzoniae]